MLHSRKRCTSLAGLYLFFFLLLAPNAQAETISIDITATDLQSGVINTASATAPVLGGIFNFYSSFAGPSGTVFYAMNGSVGATSGTIFKDSYLYEFLNTGPNNLQIEAVIKRNLDTGLSRPILGGTIEIYGPPPTSVELASQILVDASNLPGSSLAEADFLGCGRGCTLGKYGNGSTSIPSSDVGTSLGFSVKLEVNQYSSRSAQNVIKVGSSLICPDFDGDGLVMGSDLGILLGAFGPTSNSIDMTYNGSVDGEDLGILLGRWGICQ